MKPDLDQLADYTLGFLPAEEAAAIGSEVARDPELTGHLHDLQTGFETRLTGTVSALQEASRQKDGGRLPRLRKLARPARVLLLTAALLLSVGLVAAGVLYRPPLLQDDFNDGSFSAKRWLNAPEHIKEGGLVEEHGVMRLVNRGYLVTREEFPGPIEVSFDWKWIRLNELLPQYAEILTVVLRSSGTPNAMRPYEVADGVIVKIDAAANHVTIGDLPSQKVWQQTSKDSTPIPPNEWHKVRIRDDGETITVFLAGPAIPEGSNPILSVRCPFKGKAHLVGVYNREFVRYPHESYIDNFVIRSLR